ncbi:MAG TPA: excinuclease ABC subunit UvrA [Clostridia bacterium]|nr:excinuclease ABC subunit UvrA [Clostridia bacterium]
MESYIEINGARENNLKNLSLKIPKNKFVVLTGISGSGKSTLAFDTLQKECQRQYMASLGMAIDFLGKPKVDSIKGLSPSISVDQYVANRNPRSTVGTVTDVFTYLRLLYSKLGERPCPKCRTNIRPAFENGESETDLWDDDGDFLFDAAALAEGEAEAGKITCPECGAALDELIMADFSFNKPNGACPTCTGLGVVSKPNISAIIDESKSITEGAVLSWENSLISFYTNAFIAASKYYGFGFDPDTPVGKYDEIQRDYLLYGVNSEEFKRHFPGKQPPNNAFGGRFEGVITAMLRKYADHEIDDAAREKLEKYFIRHTCPDCSGERLKKESRSVTVAGVTITELSKRSLEDLNKWVGLLPDHTSESGLNVLQPVMDDLSAIIRHLLDVGLGYLSMERPATSLSGGEAQRLRLASLLGSGLTGVLYVLDEPTVGLHARDTDRLINVLKQLRDMGNTVLVIEHDTEMMRAADHIIDIGPGAGRLGGNLVACGTPSEVASCSESFTGQFLSGKERIPVPEKRRKPTGMKLIVEGAREHNLRNVTAEIPLGLLVTITGVSGSGKSTLLFDIIDKAAARRYNGTGEMPGQFDRITGWEFIDKVITIDQTPIGRIPRSNAATYTDVFTAIRNLYAELPAARKLKLASRHFSFNVPGGRCEKCQGAGVMSIKMHFMPEVQVVCPACHGRRFRREIIDVKYGGQSISDILNMSIQEAAELFRAVGSIGEKLDLLNEVGLGYLKLGQSATTLSGGEAQRIKLARELSRKGKGHTLYLLDEPTVGLHPYDVKRLISVLQRLVEAGNSVVVIEHNLDVVRTSDWVMDFGPEGGSGGGELIACGTPEQIAAVGRSYTGAYLRK